jgi:hypothetical protein
MKKTFKNFLLLTTIISIVGTIVLALIEHLLGSIAIFYGAVIILLMGIIYVTILNIKNGLGFINIISIISVIIFFLLCLRVEAQYTNTILNDNFQVEFNSMELSEVVRTQDGAETSKFIPIRSTDHTGVVLFTKEVNENLNSSYKIEIKSYEDSLMLNLIFYTKKPKKFITNLNIEGWQFEGTFGDFIIYIDSSLNWVYLYAISIKEYIQFKNYKYIRH